jgi:ribonuclease D
MRWIADNEALACAIDEIGRGPLAVDCEADSLHRYPEKVCLLQLSFGGRDLLIDPLGDLDVRRLAGTFATPGLRKILHGADYDLRVLHRDFRLEMSGLFDTMIAARLVGERSFGLAALLGKHFGVELDKRFQRADWSERPLSEPMRRYATLDTHYLEELATLLERRLAELSRLAWAREEFSRLEGVRWTEPAAENAFRKVKGGSGLDRRQLAVLRELCELRERRARRLDRPPFRVMRDEVLVRIAVEQPRSAAALAGTSGLPRSWRQGQRCRELLEAVDRGRGLPEDRLPEPRGAGNRRRGSRGGKRARALHEKRNRLAAELGLDPSLLAPRGLLEEVVQRLDRGDDPTRIPELRLWQCELLRPLFEGA